MCDNNYHYRPGLWVGRVDQKQKIPFRSVRLNFVCFLTKDFIFQTWLDFYKRTVKGKVCGGESWTKKFNLFCRIVKLQNFNQLSTCENCVHIFFQKKSFFLHSKLFPLKWGSKIPYMWFDFNFE